MAFAFNPFSTTTIKEITYTVAASGNAMFQPTIQSTDTPDYSADKVEVNAQCVILSPLAIERVA